MDYYLIQNGGERTVLRSDAPVSGAHLIPDELIHAVFSCMDSGVPFRLLDGQLELASDLRPTLHATYDWGRRTWVDARSLADVRAQKWAEIKDARTLAEFGQFVCDGSVYDASERSQHRITRQARAAQLDPHFSDVWTLADNSHRILTAPDMLAVEAAMLHHIASVHSTARALRSAIEGASTTAEVEGIAWPD